MKVLKFGGASVKDAKGVKNLLEILKTTKNDKEVLIVVSAMGKTTRKLKQVADNYLNWDEEDYDYPYDPDADDEFDDWDDEISWNSRKLIEQYHHEIMSDLFSSDHIVFKEIKNYFEEIRNFLKDNKNTYDYYVAYQTISLSNSTYSKEEIEDFLEHNKDKYDNLIYDQIISFGELISSKIIYHYLKDNGFDIEWLDARKLIKTDGNHGNADIDIEKTKEKITKAIDKTKNYITQGFIGSHKKGVTTTLGFEGSDYSATLFAYVLNAESVTVWKDVSGVFNADPKYFRNYLYGGEQITFEEAEEKNKYKALQLYGPVFLMKPLLLNRISYYDATKIAYFGASVIHPKTTTPLEKTGIPLYVKSFLNPTEIGTEISNKATEMSDNKEYTREFETYHLHSESPKTPLFMIKEDVKILSVSKKNACFIRNTDTANMLAAFSTSDVKILMSQNLIDEFLVCIESSDEFYNFKNVLKKSGVSVSEIYFPSDYYTFLLTILYPNTKAIEDILKHIDEKNIVMQQSSEDIFQIAIKYPYD